MCDTELRAGACVRLCVCMRDRVCVCVCVARLSSAVSPHASYAFVSLSQQARRLTRTNIQLMIFHICW